MLAATSEATNSIPRKTHAAQLIVKKVPGVDEAWLTNQTDAVTMKTLPPLHPPHDNAALYGRRTNRHTIFNIPRPKISYSLPDHALYKAGYSWLRSPAVEHRSLAGVLSLSCARLAADG